MDRDEARFAQSSKQMLQSNDFIVPKFQDEIRAKKPIIIYWLQALSAKVFGEKTISSYRLPSLLGFMLSIYFTYKFSFLLRKTSNDQFYAVLSALFLSSSPLFFFEAHLAKVDSFLLCIVILQQMILWNIYENRNKNQKNSWYFYFWVLLSLGILLKGPISPAISFLTIISLLILDKDFSWLKQLCFLKGICISFLIISPWAILVSIYTNGEFLEIAIKNDFLLKLQSGQESHGSPPGTYLLIICLLFWPSSIFLSYIPILGKKLIKEDSFKFCISWILGYWIMIEIIPTKLPHYILPIFPAIALLMSQSLSIQYKNFALKKNILNNLFIIFVSISGMCLIFLLVYSVSKLTFKNIYIPLLSLIFILSIFIFVQYKTYLWKKNNNIREIIIIPFCGIIINFIIISGILSNLDKIHVSKTLYNKVNSLNFTPNPIAISGYHEPSSVFYLGKDLLLLNPKEAALFLIEASNGLSIVEQKGEKDFLGVINSFDKKVEKLGIINGVNISKGENIKLILYKLKK